MSADSRDWLSTLDAAACATEIAGWRVSVRTLLDFAKSGKVDCTLGMYSNWPRDDARKIWFHKASLERLVKAHEFTGFSGSDLVSQSISSRKVAASKYFPGEVITKSDAARILRLTIRGIEDLMDRGHLKPIRLGHRLVLFRLKKVYALQRLRRPKSWRREPRHAGRRIDSGKQWEAA